MAKKLTNQAKALLAFSLAGALYLMNNASKPAPAPGPAPRGSGALPRGLRNNNPLNLRRGVKWQGLDPNAVAKDKSFDVFTSMEYGLRAALRNMQTAVTKHKTTSVTALVSRWAPSSENDTQAYIQTVAKTVPISPTQRIPMDDPYTVARILWAMARVENGPDAVDKHLPFSKVHEVVKAYLV